jgi:hypothetical protein
MLGLAVLMNNGFRWLLGLVLSLGCSTGLPTPGLTSAARSKRLIEVDASIAEGFRFPYLLLLPMDVHRSSPPFLLVEPNNTGLVTDDFERHREAALKAATVSSVGNSVARFLNVPFLVPIFPRPASHPLTYTHALDRDTLLIDEGPLQRLDLQLISMIEDARARLATMGIAVRDQILLNGFSASGTFANRFTVLHPNRVRAVACGGINGILTVPLASSGGIGLPYPIGVSDLLERTGETFALETWRRVPQLVYMGAADSNDAVAFDDGYSPEERAVVHAVLGARMQPDRWESVQALYLASSADVSFRTYEGIGHGTNGAMNQDVGEFFLSVITASN